MSFELSNLVIGSVSFSRLTDYEISALLFQAESLGITEIDTAPIYGDSEIRIGQNLRSANWRINTKVLSPGATSPTPDEVRKSVDRSLNNLQINTINNLFVHSCPASSYSPEIHSVLLELKRQGKIVNVGYSGDGVDLKSMMSGYTFDTFQATLNSIDLSNLEFFEENRAMSAYIKRPLCNQVIKIRPKLELLDLFNRIRNGDPECEDTYKKRYKIIFGNRLLRRGDIEQNIGLLESLELNAKVIVGVSTSKHLRELSNIASGVIPWDQEMLVEYIHQWKYLADKYNWKPLT